MLEQSSRQVLGRAQGGCRDSPRPASWIRVRAESGTEETHGIVTQPSLRAMVLKPNPPGFESGDVGPGLGALPWNS